jgi:hypothetical protein
MGRRKAIMVVAGTLAAAMLGVGLRRMLIEAPHDSDSVQGALSRATAETQTVALPEPSVPGGPAPLSAAPSELDAPTSDDAAGDPSATPRASESRTFRVHVVDLLGRSVPDARIDIWDSLHAAGVARPPAAGNSGAVSSDRAGVQATVPSTSADGTALATLPARNAALAASREDHGDSGVWPADTFWDAPDTTVVLSLTPYGVISGRVLEQDDRPVPGGGIGAPLFYMHFLEI